MTETIKCRPNCGTEIPLSDGMYVEMRGFIGASFYDIPALTLEVTAELLDEAAP